MSRLILAPSTKSFIGLKSKYSSIDLALKERLSLTSRSNTGFPYLKIWYFSVKFDSREATQEDIVNLVTDWEEWLSTQKSADPLEQIAMQLKDPNQFNRLDAVGKLAKIHDEKVIPLLENALKDSNSDVRYSAFHGLLQFSNEKVTQILIQLVQNGTDASLRKEALIRLLKLLDEKDSEPILRQLFKDSDVETKKIAAVTLYERGDRASFLLETSPAYLLRSRKQITFTFHLSLIMLNRIIPFPMELMIIQI